MSPLATIGIYDDLTSCQTGVAMRTANHKLTRGVHVVFDVIAEEVEHLLRVYLLFHAGNQDVNHVILNLCQHLLVIAVKLIVLG